jgi:hypothetical protein
MATVSDVDVRIVRDAADVTVTVTYAVTWNAFDRAANLRYAESVRFVGNDDGAGPVDDPLGVGLSFVVLISSEGRTSTSRRRSLTFSVADLDQDDPVAITDGAIRAVVTLTPCLPAPAPGPGGGRLPLPVNTDDHLVTLAA